MIISGQATPNSAMSISPATSEICSILDNGNISGKKYNTGTIPSKHKIKQSSKKHNRDNRENNRSQIKNSSNHVGLVTERSDLDLDWRGTGVGTGTGNTTPEIPASAPSSGSGGGQQQNSRNYWQKNNQKSSSSGNGNTSSNVIQINNQESKEPSRPLSADEDTNWRDHRNKPLTENNSTWRTIQSKSKNRKIQGKGKFFKRFK